MRATLRVIGVGGRLAGLLVGCAPKDGGDDPAQTASLAAPAEVVAPEGAAALADPVVVVSDDPPRELVSSSQLNGAQRALIDVQFQDEMANARQRGGPVTPTAVGYDLNGDGTDEQFVQIKSDLWCGSGDVCNI